MRRNMHGMPDLTDADTDQTQCDTTGSDTTDDDEPPRVQFNCAICDSTYKTERGRTNHIKSKHDVNKKPKLDSPLPAQDPPASAVLVPVDYKQVARCLSDFLPKPTSSAHEISAGLAKLVDQQTAIMAKAHVPRGTKGTKGLS